MDNIKDIHPGHDCSKLFETLLSDLSWRWDSRFETALSEIGIEKKDSVVNILENHLGNAWDSVTIDSAPEIVQSILVRFGGIMPGQLFYTAVLEHDEIIFCAWWPWGNGQTISIRIGSTQEASALLATLVPLESR